MSIDVSELRALSRELGNIGARSTSAMYDVFKDAAHELEDAWRRNARATSGTHGKWYPSSITTEMRTGFNIEAEVGPDAALKQGGMGPGFEYGSVNQPPHLDGQRAADEVAPRLDRRIDAALAHLGL